MVEKINSFDVVKGSLASRVYLKYIRVLLELQDFFVQAQVASLVAKVARRAETKWIMAFKLSQFCLFARELWIV